MHVQSVRIKTGDFAGDVEVLSKMKKIENIDLSDCDDLSDLGVKTIISATGGELKSVVLYGTQITGDFAGDMKTWSKMRKIENIDLSGCKSLTDQGLKKIILASGGNLRSVNLLYTNIDKTVLNEKKVLSRLNKLTTLKGLGVDEWKKLQTKLPNLQFP